MQVHWGYMRHSELAYSCLLLLALLLISVTESEAAPLTPLTLPFTIYVDRKDFCILEECYSRHKGTDFFFRNDSGQVIQRIEIIAAAPGIVEELKDDIDRNLFDDPNNVKRTLDYCLQDKDALGNYVIIDHGNGLLTKYAHLSYQSLSKHGIKKGVRVGRGQLLGESGNTGCSQEEHLHFEVRLRTRVVDPFRQRLWGLIGVGQSTTLGRLQPGSPIYWYQNSQLHQAILESATLMNPLWPLLSVQYSSDEIEQLRSKLGPSVVETVGNGSDGLLLRVRGEQNVFVLQGGKRRYVSYGEFTANKQKYDWENVIEVTPELMKSVEEELGDIPFYQTENFFEEASADFKVPSNILRAIAEVGSGWNQSSGLESLRQAGNLKALRNIGIGIMQLKWPILFGAASLIDPRTGISIDPNCRKPSGRVSFRTIKGNILQCGLSQNSLEGAQLNIRAAAAYLNWLFDGPINNIDEFLWPYGMKKAPFGQSDAPSLVPPQAPREGIESWWYVLSAYQGVDCTHDVRYSNYPFRIMNTLLDSYSEKTPQIIYVLSHPILDPPGTNKIVSAVVANRCAIASNEANESDSVLLPQTLVDKHSCKVLSNLGEPKPDATEGDRPLNCIRYTAIAETKSIIFHDNSGAVISCDSCGSPEVSLESYSFTSTKVNTGGTLTFSYEIVNHTQVSKEIRLGAQIRLTGSRGPWLDYYAGDKVIEMGPGPRSESRLFQVPPNSNTIQAAVPGIYDARFIIVEQNRNTPNGIIVDKWLDIRILPNALTVVANNQILTTTSINGKSTLEVFDLNGRRLKSLQLDQSFPLDNLQLRSIHTALPNGIYLCLFSYLGEDQKLHHKLIKQYVLR